MLCLLHILYNIVLSFQRCTTNSNHNTQTINRKEEEEKKNHCANVRISTLRKRKQSIYTFKNKESCFFFYLVDTFFIRICTTS